MTQDIKSKLLELGKSPYANTLKAFLNEKLSEIDSVDGVTTLEEVLGKQHAKKLIKGLFSFLEDKSSITRIPSQYE
jgi:hypothetical protein